jgi:hypothetical protein
MRYGRPDAALAVFEILREGATTSRWIRARPAHAGRLRREPGPRGLAQSMRLETPVIHPSKLSDPHMTVVSRPG